MLCFVSDFVFALISMTMAAAGAIWRRHSTDDGIHWLQVNEVGVDSDQYIFSEKPHFNHQVHFTTNSCFF
jgi:hypothetical protein